MCSHVVFVLLHILSTVYDSMFSLATSPTSRLHASHSRCSRLRSSSEPLLVNVLGTKPKDICMVTPSRFFCRYVSEFARGLRRIKWRSTHLSIVSTESVDGSRCSAFVRVMCDDVTRNVAAMPFKDCFLGNGLYGENLR